jgi:hypothetical protein
VSEADRERLHEQYQRRHVRAHEHAASVHDQAAEMHQDAAKFFDEHDESGKADWERDLADRRPRRRKLTAARQRPSGRTAHHLIRGLGKSSRTVCCRPCAGPTIHSCPSGTGVVQQLGSSIGSSRGRTALDLLDRSVGWLSGGLAVNRLPVQEDLLNRRAGQEREQDAESLKIAGPEEHVSMAGTCHTAT